MSALPPTRIDPSETPMPQATLRGDWLARDRSPSVDNVILIPLVRALARLAAAEALACTSPQSEQELPE